MFIGRNLELAALDELYESEKFEMAVLYGRHRVGKTELIHQFIEGKRAIYFTGIESNEKYNLECFGKTVRKLVSKKRILTPETGNGFTLDGIVFAPDKTAATSSKGFVVESADFSADKMGVAMDAVKAMEEDAASEKSIFADGIWNGAEGTWDGFGGLGENPETYEDASFDSFLEVFGLVERLAGRKRLVLVIDEFPRLARASKEFVSSLKLLADRANPKLMLILCGASGSMTEEYLLSEKALLYGSRTFQMELQPFDFADTCRFLKGFSGGDTALLYGIVGGIPQYLLQMDNELGVEENIKNLFFDSSSPLFEEPERLLRQEVREPALYNALLTAIATGASRMSEISERVGEDTCVCATYLKTLLALGIVRKETPYGEKASRKSVYTIEDNLFRFWYRFVPEHASLIASGGADAVYEEIEPCLPEFMEKVYEEICRQRLWKLRESKKVPVEFKDLGRWWGTDPLTHAPTEIAIMGEQDDSAALFGACDWSEKKMGAEALEELVRKSRIFGYSNAQFYLFSKSGFTKECVDAAAKLGNAMLVQCRF